jgi:hypothetical protein
VFLFITGTSTPPITYEFVLTNKTNNIIYVTAKSEKNITHSILYSGVTQSVFTVHSIGPEIDPLKKITKFVITKSGNQSKKDYTNEINWKIDNKFIKHSNKDKLYYCDVVESDF